VGVDDGARQREAPPTGIMGGPAPTTRR